MTASPKQQNVTFSAFAQGLTAETAFDVLAVANKLKATGKDVIELQIGDSPFETTKHAAAAGKNAIDSRVTHYCASPGLPTFRGTAAQCYQRDYGVNVDAENIV